VEEKLSRTDFEKEANESKTTLAGTPEERFWTRQPSQADTIAMGREYISKVSLYPMIARISGS